tara:strand:- start:99875 stop:103327 length:3453 start_codon:yes stop_codon:yes gene_type:complete
MLTLSVLPALAFALGQEPEKISLGTPLASRIAIEDPSGESPTLLSHPSYAGEPTHVKRFSFLCPKEGIFSISLRSFDFDSFLILRNGAGTILQEDDDGLLPYPQDWAPLHSFVEFQAQEGETFLLDAVALHGDLGQFELLIEQGPRGGQPLESLVKQSSADARAWVQAARPKELDLRFARILLDAGRRMMSLGQPSQALPFFEEAYPIWEELGHPLDVWRAHFEYSECLNFLGKTKEAEESLLSALSLLEAYIPENEEETREKNTGLFELNIVMGDCLINQSRYIEAIQILESALEWADKTSGTPTHLALLNCLGRAYHYTIEFNKAGDFFGAALQGYLDLNEGNESLSSAQIRNNLGLLFLDQNQITRARQEQEWAFKTQRALLPPLSLDLADTHSNLGTIAARTSDNEVAEKHFLETLRIRKALLPPGHRRLAQARFNLGLLYYNMGPKHDRKAKREIAKSIQLLKGTVGTEHKDFLYWSGQYALVLIRMEKIKEAEVLLAEVFQISQEVLGKDHLDTLKTAINLAVARHILGDTDGAALLAMDTRTRIESKIGPAQTDIMEIDILRIRIAMEKGDQSSAWGIAQQAYWNAVQQFRKQLYSSSTGIQYAYLVHHRRLLNRALSILPHNPGGSAEQEAIEMVLHWKGRIGRNLQWAQAQLWKEGIKPQKILDEITESRSHLSSAILMMPDSITLEDVKMVGELRNQAQGLERNLWTLVGEPTLPARIPLNQLLASMPEESAALLFFAWRPTIYANNPNPYEDSDLRVFAWTLRPDEEPERFDVGTVKGLRNQIFEYLNSTRGASGFSTDSGPSPGEEIYKNLWEPFVDNLAEANPVFLSPDVFVTELPFEIIPEGDRYLAEDWSFVYMDDLTQHLRLPTKPSQIAGDLLAVGDVDYGLPEELEIPNPTDDNRTRTQPTAFWAALENTGQEAMEITLLHQQKGLGKLTHLTGKEPTSPRLLESIPRQAYIHLATHGFFEPEWLPSQEDRLEFKENGEALLEVRRKAVNLMPGYLSGLVMTGANLSAPLGSLDSYLSAEELALSDLSQCRLAVLSACETSLGSEKQGEGLMSLRRSFHLAGAETVVSSLWQVKDESTRELMTAFYRGMWEGGLSRSDALTRARRKLIKNLRRRGVDSPKSWGPFILSGDWR